MATVSEKLHDKINELNGKLERLSEKTEANGKQINRVYEALYGNGKPGLISEFRELRQSVLLHHESEKDKRGDWKWAVTTIVAIAAVIVAFFK